MYRTACCLALLASACNEAPPPTDDGGAPIDAEADRLELGRPERCNGIDDDLDQKIDEGCPVRVAIDVARWEPNFSLADDGRQAAFSLGASLPDPIIWLDLASGTRRLLDDGRDSLYASVSGEWATWQMYSLAEMRAVNLTTGEVRIIPRLRSQYISFRSRFSKGRLVWSEGRTATESWPENLVLHDLSTRQTREISGSESFWHPLIEGDTLVWESGSLETQVSTGIYVLDLATNGTPRKLTSAPRTGYVLGGLGGGWVTALENTYSSSAPNEQCEPVALRIADGQRVSLGAKAAGCDQPFGVNGRWAVVEADPAGASDLWLVELATGKRTRVTYYDRRSTAAQMRGDVLFWLDDRHGTLDLYRMDLSDFDRGDFFPEGLPPQGGPP